MATDVTLRLLIEAVDKSSRQLKSVADELRRTTDAAAGLGVKSQKAGEQGRKGLDNLAQAAKASRQALEGVAQAATTVGIQMGLIGAGVAAAFVIPMRSAARFESTMAGVKAVTGATGEAFDELSAKAADLGRTTRFTAEEAAAGMRFLGMAGFETTEILSSIKPALDLAAAGQLDLATSADIASNVLTAMQIPATEFIRVADVMAKTATSANTSVGQLGEALSYAGTIAASAGIDLETTNAIIGRMGDAGVQATRAGVALRTMIAQLAAATDKSRAALDKLGVAIAYTDDGGIDLVTTLRRLGDANMGVSEATAIFNRRAAGVAVQLSKNIDSVDELIMANRNAAGAAAEMAETMEDTLEGAIRRIIAALDGLARAFGDPLLTPVKELVDLLASLANELTNVAEKFPVLAGAITGTAGALGGLLIVLAAFFVAGGTLLRLILALGRGFGGLPLIIAKVRTGLALLSRFLVANPWVAAALAIGAAALSLVDFGKSASDVAKDMKEAREKFDETVVAIDNLVSTLEFAEEGTDEYKEAALDLRKRLEEIAKGEDDLAVAAYNAAQAIDGQTGKIEENNAAIEKFRDLQFDLLVLKVAEEMRELEKAQKETADISVWYHVLDVFNSVNLWLGRATDSTRDLGRELDVLRVRSQQTADEFIQRLITLGKIDPSMGISRFVTVLKTLGPITDTQIEFMVEAFRKRREAHIRAATESVAVAKKETVELVNEAKNRVTQQVAELAELSEAYKKIDEAAQVSPEATELQQAAMELLDKRRVAVDKLAARLRELAKVELQGAEEAKKASLEAIATLEARGELEAEEVKERKLAAEAAYQEEVVRIREEALEAFRQAGASEVEAAENVADLLVQAKKDSVDKQTALENQRVKVAMKLREDELQHRKRMEDLQVTLVSNRVKKELSELDWQYERGLISLENYLDKRLEAILREMDAEIAAMEAMIAATTDPKEREELQLRLQILLEGKDAARAEAEQFGADLRLKRFEDEQDLINDINVMRAEAEVLAAEGTLERLRQEHDARLAEFERYSTDYMARVRKTTDDEALIKSAQEALDAKRRQMTTQHDRRMWMTRLSMAQTYASGASQMLTQLYELGGRKRKELFMLAKAAALAEAVINTARAITEAMPNIPLAILIGAMGAVQIATIAAQKMAKGGKIIGGSGTKDDVPVLAMGGEYVHPVDAVRHYGVSVMEAMRQKLVPKELFSALSPSYSPYIPSMRRYQEGGMVAAGAAAGSASVVVETTPIIEQTFVNITDPREVDRYLATPAGQNAVLNVLSSRLRTFRRIVGAA